MLVVDVVVFIYDFGYECVYIVGYDWGGVIVWVVVILWFVVVDKLVIFNVLYFGVFGWEMCCFEQRKCLWYVGFFQFFWLFECLLVFFGCKGLGGVWFGSYSVEDMYYYEIVWIQFGVVIVMINYYCVLICFGNVKGWQVYVFILLLWGEKDLVLVFEFVDNFGKWVFNLKIVKFFYVIYWVMCDEMLWVN